jgi:hypothetical protein
MSVAMETLRSQSKSLEALSFKEPSKEAFIDKEAFIEAVKEELEAQIRQRVRVSKIGRMNNERFGLSA